MDESEKLVTRLLHAACGYRTDNDLLLREAATEIAQLRASLAAAEAELERDRICHAGCGVIARANTPKTLAKCVTGIHPDYRSDSVQAVAEAVAREIGWRERALAAEDKLRAPEEMPMVCARWFKSTPRPRRARQPESSPATDPRMRG